MREKGGEKGGSFLTRLATFVVIQRCSLIIFALCSFSRMRYCWAFSISPLTASWSLFMIESIRRLRR